MDRITSGAQAIEYVHSFYGLGKKEGMSNGNQLMALLGDPISRLKCIHVAGTNGKGSTCSFLDSVLRTQGYKTGLYTSPYLQVYNERIRINGKPIEDDFLAVAADKVRIAIEYMHANELGKPTEFEVGTAIAFTAFDLAGVDYAVIEVGLGGRLDPTNIITPMLSVIAHIGLDHVKILGDTIEQIAWEKAGIIKEGVPVVAYDQEPSVMKVFEDTAKEKHSKYIPLDFAKIENLKMDERGACFGFEGFDNIRINLPGEHQVHNAATAVKALLAVRELGVEISDENLLRGIQNAVWPGRLEWMGNILLDGAHNSQGVAALKAYTDKYLSGREVALVTGVLRDKDYLVMAPMFADMAKKFFLITPDSHKALSADDLTNVYENLGVKTEICDSVEKAIDLALKSITSDGVVVIAGSLYLVGEARTIIENKIS